ncbi:MAG: hypothetical protein EOM64_10235, partial [Erysipelotrichia bacterium]|nr:hypothetical protein [Erysipelotrichia bacterium]
MILLSILALLSGCTRYPGDLSVTVNERLAEVQAGKADKPYYNSTYYYYYTEPSIGRISSDQTSNTFSLNGTRFVMNLNIPSIINSSYYLDAVESEDAVSSSMSAEVETSGTYTDYDGNDHDFSVKIYNKKGIYYTIVSTPYMEFYSVSTKNESAELAGEMLRIARSIRLMSERVLEEFSSRQVISYARKKVELFQNIAPENGVVDELFSSENNQIGDHIDTGTGAGNYATDNYPD